MTDFDKLAKLLSGEKILFQILAIGGNFPRPSEAPSACSMLDRSVLRFRVQAACPLTVVFSLALLGQKLPEVNQIIRDHRPANPPFYPVHSSVTTPSQSLSSLENTDPPFASHPPTLRSAKPTLLLPLGSGLIPTLLIGNRYPPDPQLLRLAHVL